MRKLNKVNVTNNSVEMYGCYKEKFCLCKGKTVEYTQKSGSTIYHSVSQTTTTTVARPGGGK